jgi:hypothetical protein
MCGCFECNNYQVVPDVNRPADKTFNHRCKAKFQSVPNLALVPVVHHLRRVLEQQKGNQVIKIYPVLIEPQGSQRTEIDPYSEPVQSGPNLHDPKKLKNFSNLPCMLHVLHMSFFSLS